MAEIPHRCTTSRACRRMSLACGLAAAGVGLVVLLGSAIDPESIPVDMPTALFLLVMGVAVALEVYRLAFSWRRRAVLAICLAVVLWSVLELVEYGLRLSGRGEELKQYRVIDMLLVFFEENVMSPVAAGSFILASIALFGISTRPGGRRRTIAATCAALAAALNLVFLFSYLTNRQPFRELEIAVAFPTALAFVFLGVALLSAAGPRNLFLRSLLARTTTGLLLRAFLPTVVGLIVLGEVLRSHLVRFYTGGDILALARDQKKLDRVRDLALFIQGPWIYVIGLAVFAVVYRVAGRVGGSLEKARAELNKTLEELRVARTKAESATVARDFFLAQVSHELRTPLNHVLGFCQLLELTSLDDSQQRDVRKIRRAGVHLQSLIDDILDYQKILMGRIPMEWEDFDTAPWVTEVAEWMEPKIREKGNRLEIHCAPDLGYIRSDRKRFRQVLTNLLSNAAKFTTQGLISVTARRQQAQGKDWAVVSVADNGKGISPENLSKLFKPFGQINDKRDNPEGTGLGLAICTALCEKMGGAIGVTSTPGKETAFTFRLPAIPAPTNPVTSPAPPAARPGQPPTLPAFHSDRPSTVLVIDDDPQVGELMKRFLEKEGFAIHVALTGVQALEKVKTLRPDVITLDMLMPGIDGWGVLAALKTDTEIADIPVIILSIVDDRSKGLILGANEYVTKPVDWERLLALLRKYRAPARGGILVVDEYVLPASRPDDKELYHA